MKPIRTAFIINDFSGAGAQKLVVDILSSMDRARFQPVLITLFDLKDGATMYHLLPADIEIVRMNFRGLFDFGSWMQLYRALTRLRIDVVISHLFFSNTVARVLKPFVGYQVIATEHNTYINKKRLHQIIDRILAMWTYAIIAVSTTVKTFTAAQENIPLSKFRVILNGTTVTHIVDMVQKVDVGAVKKELGLEDARIMINVARLSEQKNHALLLKGFALIAKEQHGLHLLILGEGEKRAELEAEARALALDEQVHFLGYRNDIYRYHAVSDFFVSTSTIEGLSIAYIEALAAGLPILSTKTSGTDEMIEEGINGFFIHEHTPAAVSEGLARMLVIGPTTMREGARKSALRFDISTTTKGYEDLILESLSSKF